MMNCDTLVLLDTPANVGGAGFLTRYTGTLHEPETIACDRKGRFALTTILLGGVAACGLSDAETTWCADNKTEVLTAAENLALVELDVAFRPITGRELLTRVGAGEIQAAHIQPGSVLARTNDGEMLLGDLEFLDEDQIVEAMAEAWTTGGSEGEPVTIVETPAELIPLTGADFDRACVAAFESR